jgi:lambda family phage tail tape measure protein
LVVVAGARVIARFTALADSFVNLRNRLQATLGSLAQAQFAQRRLLEISLATRTGIDATGDAFARLALGAKDLGIGTDRLLGITETLNKAIILSGSSSQEARNAMIQLSQGIASGALRGDELRSVLEQLPLVARIIAKEFGVTIGALRDLGKAGALTTDRLLRAFENASEGIDEQFGSTVVTISQAFTNLTTQFTAFIAAFSDSSGAVTLLTTTFGALESVLAFLTDNIELLNGVLIAMSGLIVAKVVTALNLYIGRILAARAATAALATGEVVGSFATIVTGLTKGAKAGTVFRASQVAANASLLGFVKNTSLFKNAVAAITLNATLGAGAFTTLRVVISSVGIALRGLFAVILANPIGLLLTAITLLGIALITLVSKLRNVSEELEANNLVLKQNRELLDEGIIATKQSAQSKADETVTIRENIKALQEQNDVMLRLRTIAVASGSSLQVLFALFDDSAENAVALNKQLEETNSQLRELDNTILRLRGNAPILTTQNIDPKVRTAIADIRFEIEQLGKTARQANIDETLREFGFGPDSKDLGAKVLRDVASALFDAQKAADAATEARNRLKSAREADARAAEREAKLLSNQAQDLINSQLTLAEREISIDQELAKVKGVLTDLTGDEAKATSILATEKERLLKIAREEAAPNALAFLEDRKDLTDKLMDVEAQRAMLQAEFGALGRSEADATNLATEAIRAKTDALKDEASASGVSLVNRFSLITAAIAEREQAIEDLRAAEAAGRITTEQSTETLRRQRRETVGAGNAASDYADKLRLLSVASAEGAVSQEELVQLTREARIELLETQRTFGAGAERAFLKFVDDATDAGAQTEKLFNDVFNGLSDVIQDFVKTGELSFKDLAATISATLIEIGTQQALAGVFGASTPGGFGGGAGGGLGGLLGGLFGGGGGGGGLGGLFGGLFGFQNGGSFTVGSGSAVASVPGIDNRVVAFRAKDGEEVSIKPKNQVGLQGGSTVINFNVSTPDANSFNRSRSQTSDRAARAVQRATARRR